MGGVAQRVKGGGDSKIRSPGISPKKPLSGMELRDPLYGRQGFPESKSVR